MSFAETAKKFNYKRPLITEENRLEIVSGRHPLQELCVDTFVSNDTRFEESHLHLVTGANYSGKSVYLKQVQIIYH